MAELRLSNKDNFVNILKMTPETFDKLVSMVRCRIDKWNTNCTLQERYFSWGISCADIKVRISQRDFIYHFGNRLNVNVAASHHYYSLPVLILFDKWLVIDQRWAKVDLSTVNPSTTYNSSTKPVLSVWQKWDTNMGEIVISVNPAKELPHQGFKHKSGHGGQKEYVWSQLVART